MKGVVTDRQVFFMLFLSLSGFSIVNMPKIAMDAAGTGAWITILLTAIIFSVGIFIITSLNKKFEGKTIFEYTTQLLGKPLAFIICFLYGFYFLLILIGLFGNIVYFIKSSFLPLTPLWVLLILFISVAGYAAYKGITNIGRLSELIGLTLIIVAIISHIAMFIIGDIKQIQPLFEKEKMGKYLFGINDLIVPFLGIDILTIIPFGEINRKKGRMYSVLAVLFIGLFYIIVSMTATMMLGQNEVTSYRDSTVEALRITEIPDTVLLERPDFLYLTIGISGIILCVCVIYFVVVENVSKLIPKVNKNIFIIIIGIITFISGLLIDDRAVNFLFEYIVRYFGLATSFLIPIILIIISKVKKS